MALSVLSGCNLGVAPDTPVPTPDLPRVEFIAPPNNSQVLEQTDFPLDIIARDASVGIARLEFYIDETLITEVTPQDDEAVPVFRVQVNWLAQGVGLHGASAIAYRPDGTRSDEARLTLEVLPRER